MAVENLPFRTRYEDKKEARERREKNVLSAIERQGIVAGDRVSVIRYTSDGNTERIRGRFGDMTKTPGGFARGFGLTRGENPPEEVRFRNVRRIYKES